MGTYRTFRTDRERRSIGSANLFQQPSDALSKTENGMRRNTNFNVLPESLAWDAMIRDAKKQIEDLKLAIELFEKKKAAGERWPGARSESRSDQEAAQQDAAQSSTQFLAS